MPFCTYYNIYNIQFFYLLSLWVDGILFKYIYIYAKLEWIEVKDVKNDNEESSNKCKSQPNESAVG